MKKLFKTLILSLMCAFTLCSCNRTMTLTYTLNLSSKEAVITGHEGCPESSAFDFLLQWVLPETVDSNGVTYTVVGIESNVFKGCEAFNKITIPDTYRIIGTSAFEDCIGLNKIVIPASVTSIGADAFKGCLDLTIYCEVSEQPSTWNLNWNSSNCKVVWGS